MKILIIVRKLTQGGVQQQTVSFARAAVAQGIQTHVLILKSSPDELKLPENIIIHRINIREIMFSSFRGVASYLYSHILLPAICPKSKDYGTGRFLSKWFKKIFLADFERIYGKPDFIFIRAQGAFDLLNAYRCPGVCYRYVDGNPHEYRDRLPFINPVGKYLNRQTYGNADFICVSSDLAARISEIAVRSGKPGNVTVFRNFVDIEEIRRKSEDTPPIPLPEGDYIVSVGRLVETKQQHLCIRAMKHLPEELKLVIVGDGPEKKRLKKLVSELKLEDRVLFTGNASNPYPYILNAKALVHTSEKEGFGLIFLEALILNTPVVAMESIGGMRDILKGQILSNQIVPRSVGLLADKIKETISNPYQSVPDMYQHYDSKTALHELINEVLKNEQSISPQTGKN